jgi:signal transduction histidine kinase
LLLLARAENREVYTVSECQVEDVLKQIVQEYSRIGDRKSLLMELNIEERPVLEIEPSLLRVVLGNLVRNAYAHTQKGGVKITLKNDGVIMEDTGVGMSDTELARAFDRHYRASEKAGSGIGLSLVKRICQRYGWNISMASEAGIGTKVRLWFK